MNPTPAQRSLKKLCLLLMVTSCSEQSPPLQQHAEQVTVPAPSFVAQAEAMVGHHTNMPDGFTLLCDGQGNYGIKEPDGWVNRVTSRRKDDAIMGAWILAEADKAVLQLPPARTNWIECKP